MNCEQAQDLFARYAAGTLSLPVRQKVDDHFAGCPDCRAEVERVLPVLREASRLPLSIEPPPELWPAISARISGQKMVEGRFGSPVRPWWTQAPVLAAAAVALVVLSSTVTSILVRRGDARATAGFYPVMLSSDFLMLEAQYARASDEIIVALAQGDVRIAPRTRQILQRNLRIIDNAIDESRAALARDPANQELKDMVLTTHQHKLDLLRRVTSPSEL